MDSSAIEEDLRVEGDIRSSEGRIEIKGAVVGDVAAEMVIVQANGSIQGKLSARSAMIEGRIAGSLVCDDLRIASMSHVQADVTAQTMTTESGAKVVGKVKITGEQ